jgi:hypothetical protein
LPKIENQVDHNKYLVGKEKIERYLRN